MGLGSGYFKDRTLNGFIEQEYFIYKPRNLNRSTPESDFGSRSDPSAPNHYGSRIKLGSEAVTDSRSLTYSASSPKRSTTASLSQTYVRPRHDRVFCEQCSEHPEGFRGPHELQRHKARSHQSAVKKWICIEPAQYFEDFPQPINPLSNCKSCSQKKAYGVYYNAAAHLRRTHFQPKPRSGGEPVKEPVKRSGMGGGDWPPMSVLKNWMQEVEDIQDSTLQSKNGTILNSSKENNYVVAEEAEGQLASEITSSND